MTLVVSGNSLAYGPAPIGAGSCLTMFYTFGGGGGIPILLGPPFIPTCVPGTPAIVGVLPSIGTVFDSCGFLAPPPPFGFFDGGSGRFTFTGAMPGGAGVVPITFQAAGMTPGGAIWLTNAVTIVFGDPVADMPVFPAACGATPPLNDGQAMGIATPPGFTFYGFPTPTVDMDTNGFVDFPAPLAAGCDTTGTSGDLGCAPVTGTARPRVDVNHADYDLGILPVPPFSCQG